MGAASRSSFGFAARVALVAFLPFALSLNACVNGDAPPAEVTAAARLALAPALVNFGEVAVGATSAATALTLLGAPGESASTITAVTSTCPEFQLQLEGLVFPLTVAAGSRATFPAVFAPSYPGPMTCTIEILHDGGKLRQLYVTGTGRSAAQPLQVRPSAVDFAEVGVGTDGVVAVDLFNLGERDIEIGQVQVTGFYRLTSGPLTSIPAGKSRQVLVACAPPMAGPNPGMLIVQPRSAEFPLVNIPLQCIGVPSALGVSVAPATFYLRPGEVAALSPELRPTVTMRVQTVAIEGDGFTLPNGPAANTELLANSATPMKVQYTGTKTGEFAGRVRIQVSDGANVTSRAVGLRAFVDPAYVVVDRPPHFTGVCVGQPKALDIQVMAGGLGTFAVERLEVTSGPFAASAGVFGELAARQANGIGVRIVASPTTPGEAIGNLRLATTIPSAKIVDLEMSVTGLAPGLSAASPSVEFGTAVVAQGHVDVPVTIGNCETTSAQIAEVAIEGNDADQFAFVAPTGTEIAPQQTHDWQLRFTPTRRGRVQATAVFVHAGGRLRVALQAEGVAAFGPDDATSVGSYYTCQAASGNGVGAWLIAFATLLRLRRRPGHARGGDR